jgi:chemotaxis signal transduction protein
MSDDRLRFSNQVAEMRDAFDRSFTEARPPEPPPEEDLLAIQIGAKPYALRLSEISGLFSDRRITPLPGSAPTLLGLAGFRGAIVPVYDLAALLGHPPTETTRWLVTASGVPVAFAFAVMVGYVRVAREAIVAQATAQDERRHVQEFARTPELVRPIVHLPSVLDAARRQVITNIGAEER